MPNVFSLALISCLALTAFGAAKAEDKIRLPSRPGVEAEFFYQSVAQPIAQVILFEGGSGQVTGSNAGFVQTTRKLFAGHNIAYAMFAMPSGIEGNPDPKVIGEYRASEAHIQDVDAIIAWLRQKSAAPVWLLGVSAGTVSVGWLGTRVHQPVAGLVFASSVFGGPRGMGSIGIQQIHIPTLITHHRNDGCLKFHDPLKVPVFTKLLPADTKREIVFFEGGTDVGRDPCKQHTFHTYNGIEPEVVAVMARFIKENSPP
jgi:hypothetical protein